MLSCSYMMADQFSPDSNRRRKRRRNFSVVGPTTQASSLAPNCLEMSPAYFDDLQRTNQIEIDLIADMVAVRWRLRRIWRYETAMPDIAVFSAPPDKSKGLSTALRFDIHLSRTYRRSLQELYRLRGAGLKNEPTESAKSQLNGKKEALNGDRKQENPTREYT